MRDYDFPILNQRIDVSKDYGSLENSYFHAMRLMQFCPNSGEGVLEWDRYARKPRMAFNQVSVPFEPAEPWEFPPEYGSSSKLPFAIEFVSENTIRLRVSTRQHLVASDAQSLMLAGEVPVDSWSYQQTDDQVVYSSAFGSVTVTGDPWHVVLRDKDGRILTGTQRFGDSKSLRNSDPIPFSFVRRSADQRRTIAASFTLAPDEKLFGCGESFTRLNKRGQKVVLWTNDAHGVQTDEMYKPIPFFLSSRGYGMFVHSMAPITFDFGASYDQANVLYLGDDYLDLFIFLGEPQDILSAYTSLTGRSPLPPLWSFGLWMSRITYKSEAETRQVANKLREHQIPCDVIHLDTGWFDQDWRCDYRFSQTRFPSPQAMVDDLRKQGFRISLWQLPYITPTNALYKEAIEKGYVVRDASGHLPTEDAIIDFSNPEAVRWYQGLLAGLLQMGVGAIKVDFGEAAPLHGLYASGKTGFLEHNYYPLRYNKAAADITKEITGESIIWARSTWAGSQRYPVHWGGDAENTDSAMAATLRAGLSLGLCGFSFWSHDIGGFVVQSPEDLYTRWAPFGMLTSHSRCHGAPPKEPWAYGAAFTANFRRSVELKYKLMPYIYAQAKEASDRGFPMMRTLFFDYPQDPTCWHIDDQYLLGTDVLVAPMMEAGQARDVYLPPGTWIDYQQGTVWEGGMWHNIMVGLIPAVILVKDRTVLPHIALAQCTDQMDWSRIELKVFDEHKQGASGLLYLPGQETMRRVTVALIDGEYRLTGEDFGDGVDFRITS